VHLTVMCWYLFRKAEENDRIASTVQPTSLHAALLCDVMQNVDDNRVSVL